MNLIKKLISKYTGSLRSWKATYVIHNLLNARKLQHNKKMAEELGLDINLYHSIGTKDLPKLAERPWLDDHNTLSDVKSDPRYQALDPQWQAHLDQFFEEGYILLKKYHSPEKVKEHNDRLDELAKSGQAYTNYGGTKMMDVYAESPWIDRSFFKEEALLQLLRVLFDKKVIPFQTIHFYKGSEQKAHSDSIHMSTYPPGYLVGVWTALEDIGLDQGPLFYYPRSHRWPYVSCEDYNSGNTTWRIGKNSYAAYEKYIQAQVDKSGLERVIFEAEAGDVLIWHANLIHGGMPMNDDSLTRRSMVGHYYADEVFCYHEISQRPSHIEQEAL